MDKQKQRCFAVGENIVCVEYSAVCQVATSSDMADMWHSRKHFNSFVQDAEIYLIDKTKQ